MLVLDTIIHETVWGGDKLASRINKKGIKIGHLYSVFCRKGISNLILNGRYKGNTLNDIFPFFKSEMGMESYDFFPLTIALTEAGEDLSIQVHPDDEWALRVENASSGKRESWYFIEPPTNGKIVNGCIMTDVKKIRDYVKSKEYGKVIDHLPIMKGDYVFVEPGTLHSISAGSLVYEIEEGADATYRFYDYDRLDLNGNKRKLDTETALECLKPRLKSKIRHYEDGKFIAESTFSTMKLEKTHEYVNIGSRLQCLTIVDGVAVCDDIDVCNGLTVILWPGEKVTNANIELAFVAQLTEGV